METSKRVSGWYKILFAERPEIGLWINDAWVLTDRITPVNESRIKEVDEGEIFGQLEEKEKMKRLLTEMSDSILQTLRGNHVSFNTNSDLFNRAKEFIE